MSNFETFYLYSYSMNKYSFQLCVSSNFLLNFAFLIYFRIIDQSNLKGFYFSFRLVSHQNMFLKILWYGSMYMVYVYVFGFKEFWLAYSFLLKIPFSLEVNEILITLKLYVYDTPPSRAYVFNTLTVCCRCGDALLLYFIFSSTYFITHMPVMRYNKRCQINRCCVYHNIRFMHASL